MLVKTNGRNPSTSNYLNNFVNDFVDSMWSWPSDIAKDFVVKTKTTSVIDPTMNGYSLHEEDSKILVKVDLPGVDKSSIDLDFSDGTLTIKAHRHKEKTNAIYDYVSYGEISRVFTLNYNIKENEITAKYENGVLTVTLPFIKESKNKSTKIKIE